MAYIVLFLILDFPSVLRNFMTNTRANYMNNVLLNYYLINLTCIVVPYTSIQINSATISSTVDVLHSTVPLNI